MAWRQRHCVSVAPKAIVAATARTRGDTKALFRLRLWSITARMGSLLSCKSSARWALIYHYNDEIERKMGSEHKACRKSARSVLLLLLLASRPPGQLESLVLLQRRLAYSGNPPRQAPATLAMVVASGGGDPAGNGTSSSREGQASAHATSASESRMLRWITPGHGRRGLFVERRALRSCVIPSHRANHDCELKWWLPRRLMLPRADRPFPLLLLGVRVRGEGLGCGG